MMNLDSGCKDCVAVDAIETQQCHVTTVNSQPRCHSLCVSLSSLCKVGCAVCRECWLPLTTVARIPFWSDFIASGTLIPRLTMNKNQFTFPSTTNVHLNGRKEKERYINVHICGGCRKCFHVWGSPIYSSRSFLAAMRCALVGEM